MSKTFFIFFSIPNDLFLGESYIYHQSVCFTRKWEGCGGYSQYAWGVTWRFSDSVKNLSGGYSEGMLGFLFSM